VLSVICSNPLHVIQSTRSLITLLTLDEQFLSHNCSEGIPEFRRNRFKVTEISKLDTVSACLLKDDSALRVDLMPSEETSKGKKCLQIESHWTVLTIIL
jgi:hypothetical protein